MIRQLREKQNREVEEYNKAINRQVLNKMHSQVALWETERPTGEILDLGTIENYDEAIKKLTAILSSKLETIQSVDLNNSGSEKQYKEIIDNSELINTYNLLVKPLSSGKVLKTVKNAIENLIQPLQPLIEQLNLAFQKLVENKRAVGVSRINPVLSSYGLFDYMKQQYKNNVFVPIHFGNLQSYYSNNFIQKMGPDIVARLKTALDEYEKNPSLRKEAMASQVGRLSPEELKGLLKIEGISEFPLSTAIGVPVETQTDRPVLGQSSIEDVSISAKDAKPPRLLKDYTPAGREYYEGLGTISAINGEIKRLNKLKADAQSVGRKEMVDRDLITNIEEEIIIAEQVKRDIQQSRGERATSSAVGRLTRPEQTATPELQEETLMQSMPTTRKPKGIQPRKGESELDYYNRVRAAQEKSGERSAKKTMSYVEDEEPVQDLFVGDGRRKRISVK